MSYFINLVNFYSIVITNPQNIFLEIEKISLKDSRILLIVHKILLSLFLSGSFFILKKSLKFIDVVVFFVSGLIFFISINLISFLINQLIHFFYYKALQESIDVNRLQKNYIALELGFLPLIFLTHFSIISKYFDNLFIFLLGFLLIFIWIFWIWIHSFSYLWEKEIRKVMKIFFSSFIIVFLLIIVHYFMYFLLFYLIIVI